MSSCAGWSIMVSAVVSWQTSRGLLVSINIQLSVITLESQRAVSWTFTADMAVSDIITFLNYYNSPGKAKAHLDKVSVLMLRLHCACIYVGQSLCPVELSLDCPNTDLTWSAAKPPSAIVWCLYVIALWLQCLSHTGKSRCKHRAQEILSCLGFRLQNCSVNTQRQWLLWFVKLWATSFSWENQIQEYLLRLLNCINTCSAFYWWNVWYYVSWLRLRCESSLAVEKKCMARVSKDCVISRESVWGKKKFVGN